jgi:Enoyl-(Acyl carrier protein) reductase
MSAFGRLGQPDEIAAVVAFLASDAAGWVTAQNIRVNGGAGMRQALTRAMTPPAAGRVPTVTAGIPHRWDTGGVNVLPAWVWRVLAQACRSTPHRRQAATTAIPSTAKENPDDHRLSL